MRLLFVTFILIFPLKAQEKWPARFQAPKPALERLADKDGATVWATSHFIIVCEVDLPQSRLLSLARTMESVPVLFKGLPLPLWMPPKEKKAVVRLCADETSFVARGAPLAAAGSYNHRSAEILVRGDILLNPPQARASQLRLEPDGDLLVHELTHLATHQYGGRVPTWLNEGLAEYFASHHTGKGSYEFSQSTRQIKLHIQKHYPIERFPVLNLPSLESLTKGNSKDWLNAIKNGNPADVYRPYAAALLLTHYHLAGGAQRRSELTTYLDQSLENRDKRKMPPLIKDPQSIEKKLVAFWKPQGISIRFESE